MIKHSIETNHAIGPSSARIDARQGRRGAALFFVISIVGVLALLSFTTFSVTKTDFRITNNKLAGALAFYEADAGIRFVKGRLERQLAQGQSMSGLSANINITPPAGLDFDPVDQLDQLTNSNLYLFAVTGRHRKAKATIEAVIRQSLALDLGLFGDQRLDLFSHVNVYSYYSDVTPNPTPASSVGGVVAGSNENLMLGPNYSIDGYFVIGETPSGSVGSYPLGHSVVEVGRIDPDPLGAIGGTLATEIAQASQVNDNGSASAISGNKIDVKNHKTATVSSGNYYLTDVKVRSHATLNIDASSGPVTFYLVGGFQTWPACDINVTGNPGDFRILSDSTELIWLRPNNTIKAFIYSPYAPVRVWPNIDFFGTIWADDTDLHPGGNVYVDLSLLEKIKSNRISIVSWKEVRN